MGNVNLVGNVEIRVDFQLGGKGAKLQNSPIYTDDWSFYRYPYCRSAQARDPIEIATTTMNTFRDDSLPTTE
jgi:hypothetical protein